MLRKGEVKKRQDTELSSSETEAVRAFVTDIVDLTVPETLNQLTDTSEDKVEIFLERVNRRRRGGEEDVEDDRWADSVETTGNTAS